MCRFGGGHGLYLPARLFHDSAFPFSPGDAVTIRIDGDLLTITKE